MKYKCSKCGFIHFGELPDGYYCPLCHSNFSYFKLIEVEEKKYNRKPVNPDNFSSKRKSKNIKCIVKWDDSRLRYYFDNIEKEMDFIYFNINESNDVEVIGNIHKNPELVR